MEDTVFSGCVYVVLVAKYRRRIFNSAALTRMRAIFSAVCADFGAAISEFDGEEDRVHPLVEYPPKVSVSALVNSFKGVSSRRLRQVPSLQGRYYKGVLWSPSYFAASCGGAPLAIVAQYIRIRPTRHAWTS